MNLSKEFISGFLYRNSYQDFLPGIHNRISYQDFSFQVKQEKLGDAEVQNLMDGIFREVQVQAHIMSDRRTIYRLFKFCVDNRLTGE